MSMDHFERLRQVFDNDFFHHFHLRAYIAACISDLTVDPVQTSVQTPPAPTRITTKTAWTWVEQILYNTYYYTFHTMPPPRDRDPLCDRTAERGDHYNPIRIAFMEKIVRMFENPSILETSVAGILRKLRKHVAELLHSDA
jgi:hypothetical protein